MSANIDEILEALLPDSINKLVLMQHDVARESFHVRDVTVPDHTIFAQSVAEYIQHHQQAVQAGRPSLETAFGEGKRILNGVFNDDQFQEGYTVALQMGLDGTDGGMRAIFNALADQLKRQALYNYKDFIFDSKINRLSQAENEALAKAYFERFGAVIHRFLPDFDERTFAGNVRAALEYHLQIVGQILRVARKL